MEYYRFTVAFLLVMTKYLTESKRQVSFWPTFKDTAQPGAEGLAMGDCLLTPGLVTEQAVNARTHFRLSLSTQAGTVPSCGILSVCLLASVSLFGNMLTQLEVCLRGEFQSSIG